MTESDDGVWAGRLSFTGLSARGTLTVADQDWRIEAQSRGDQASAWNALGEVLPVQFATRDATFTGRALLSGLTVEVDPPSCAVVLLGSGPLEFTRRPVEAPVVVWACPEPGCDFRLNRAGDDHDAAAWDARVLLGARERHNAERHLSAKAVFEKLNALPARDRATARWVMSWATLESLCALHARPKPIPGAVVTLVGVPVDLDDTAVGVELRPRTTDIKDWRQ